MFQRQRQVQRLATGTVKLRGLLAIDGDLDLGLTGEIRRDRALILEAKLQLELLSDYGEGRRGPRSPAAGPSRPRGPVKRAWIGAGMSGTRPASCN